MPDTHFDVEGRAGRQHLRFRLGDPGAVLLRNGTIEQGRVGESGLGGDAEQPFDAGAHILEPAPTVFVDDDLVDHPAGQVIGHQAEPLLGFPQGCREARLVRSRRASVRGEAAQGSRDHLVGGPKAAAGNRLVDDRLQVRGEVKAGQNTGSHHLERGVAAYMDSAALHRH
jgi:hypothetical protein